MSDLELDPYYESAVDELDLFDRFEDDSDIRAFSKNKELYDSQVKAIKNALKLLKFWSEKEKKKDLDVAKQELYELLYDQSDSKIDTHKLRLKKKDLGGEIFNKMKERYPVKERSRYGYDYREIDFNNFANQMGFWMATGSGKTLVLIKLMEVVKRLIQNNEIPDRDLLLLVPSEDIKEQFISEIENYNKSGEYNININDAENINNSTQSTLRNSFGKTINLYIKRSDLISDETKDKEISFEDIENGGKWYVFLDEAHKGQSDSSKRQAYYSILARNGFLFNSSATFTDPSDIATTVHNYNIDKYNSDGHGKNIFVADQSLESITDDQFNDKTKRKTVLESLIVLTAQKMASNNLEYKYHNPLLTAFANSVNTIGSDLEMFFEVIKEIGKSKNNLLFEEAKDSVSSMLRDDTSEYEFGNDQFNFCSVDNITKEDVLREVYNTNSHGSLEVKHSPKNKKEIGFKLKTSSKPFALIRIGDNSDWLSEKLTGQPVEESYDSRSYFDSINDPDSPINLLLGSRTFYEGWDSNRPNVMMFINLGRSDKKKLIMQAIGRGMRIEPEPDVRKRLKYSEKLDLSNTNKKQISTIESLMVFATSVDNLEEIINSFKWIRDQDHYEDIKNIKESDISQNKKLLTPTYKEDGLPKLENVASFEANREKLQEFWKSLGDNMVMFHTNANEEILERMKRFLFRSEYVTKFNKPKYKVSPIKKLKSLKDHVSKERKAKDNFEDTMLSDNKIIHFRQIKANMNKVNDIKEIENSIEKVNKNPNESGKKVRNYGLNIQKLNNHYYSPILYNSTEKDSKYFKNIISVDSEIEFIEDVIQKSDELFEKADWWHFSSLSEHLDEVYIPYQNGKKFKPDFVFWIKAGDTYHIVFVDPKSKKMVDKRKIEGYKNIFEDKKNNIKEFSDDNLDIESVKVHLYMFNSDKDDDISQRYQRYFAESLSDLEDYINI